MEFEVSRQEGNEPRLCELTFERALTSLSVRQSHGPPAKAVVARC